MNTNSKYDKDFYAWALHNAKLLRQGKFEEIDVDNMAEEIESMGGREKRELVNRMATLIMHLLKWQFQSDWRSNSWKYTVKEQRIQIIDLLDESPSLKRELISKFNHIYEKALVMAVAETGIPEKNFPLKNPYSLDQCLDDEFFPE
jgi:Domain of unknown function DUF29